MCHGPPRQTGPGGHGAGWRDPRIQPRDRAGHLGDGVVAHTDAGLVRAPRAVLATNAFPSLLERDRLKTVPVYDYALMTEPLTDGQLDSIGWRNRQSLAGLANLPARRGQRGPLRRLRRRVHGTGRHRLRGGRHAGPPGWPGHRAPRPGDGPQTARAVPRNPCPVRGSTSPAGPWTARTTVRASGTRCSRPWTPWASASTREPGGGRRSYRGQISSTSTTMTATITANTMAQLRATWRSSARVCSLSGSRSAYRSLPTP